MKYISSIKCQIIANPAWGTLHSNISIHPSNVQIHKCFIPNYLNQIDSFLELLDEAELKRASKYHQKKDSQRFIIARGMLKFIASQYLGIPAAMVKIEVGNNKKPFIDAILSNRLEYNISHSGNWILLAFSLDSIGVDVEQILPSFEFEPLLPGCFSLSEQEKIQSAPDARSKFYLFWTRKESYVKAIAKGLDERLPNIPCLEGEWELVYENNTRKDWQVLSFQLDQEHWASVCFESHTKNILFLEKDR